MKSKTKYQLVIGTAAALASAVPAMAAPTSISEGAADAQPTGASGDLQSNIVNITNTLLLIIGIAAVIMLIVGGFRYIFSAGDQNAVTGAKNTILYAIIGIVVAILAYAIVNFVIGQF